MIKILCDLDETLIPNSSFQQAAQSLGFSSFEYIYPKDLYDIIFERVYSSIEFSVRCLPNVINTILSDLGVNYTFMITSKKYSIQAIESFHNFVYRLSQSIGRKIYPIVDLNRKLTLERFSDEKTIIITDKKDNYSCKFLEKLILYEEFILSKSEINYFYLLENSNTKIKVKEEKNKLFELEDNEQFLILFEKIKELIEKN